MFLIRELVGFRWYGWNWVNGGLVFRVCFRDFLRVGWEGRLVIVFLRIGRVYGVGREGRVWFFLFLKYLLVMRFI